MESEPQIVKRLPAPNLFEIVMPLLGAVYCMRWVIDPGGGERWLAAVVGACLLLASAYGWHSRRRSRSALS